MEIVILTKEHVERLRSIYDMSGVEDKGFVEPLKPEGSFRSD